MFSILGIGGAIVGIVSGVAGYMINDLAKEKAIQVALTEMQKPLADRLAEFADAKSALTAATKTVLTDDFRSIVAKEVTKGLAEREDFRKNLANSVVENPAFRNSVAEVIASQYANQLRGPIGVAGPGGKDSTNGASPSPASVADALNDNGAFRAQIADVLAARYANQLRGPIGAAGPSGKDGKDGAEGSSPKFEDFAVFLLGNYLDRLRGPQGIPGSNGRDGLSPSSDEVARTLIAKHGEEMRQLLIVRAPSPVKSKRRRLRRRR